jgi:phage major head subunit gpT-like protein
MPANAKIYRDAQRSYTAAFFAGMGEDTSGWNDMVTRLDPTATVRDIVIWLTMNVDLPRFRGRRVYSDVMFHSIELATDEYKKGMKVPEREFRRDRWGLWIEAARGMGRSVSIAHNRTVWDLLVHGFSGLRGLAYDGQFFFDDEHRTIAGEAQRNAWDLPLTPENYDTVYANLETIKLPNGEFAHGGGPMTTRILAGPKYRSMLRKMLDLPHDGNNPRYQQSEYRIIPQLSGPFADYWFLLLVLGGHARPVFFKEEVPPQFAEQVRPDTDAQFEHGERRYGVDAEWGMTFGRWEVMQGSTGAAG